MKFGILLLLATGVAGMVAGVVELLRGAMRASFPYETYGGPGTFLAGLCLFLLVLYVRTLPGTRR